MQGAANPLAMALANPGMKKEQEVEALGKQISVTEQKLAKQVKINEMLENTDPNIRKTDWAQAYNSWDVWEDTEEIASSLDSAKSKQTSLMEQARSMTGCGSHDRSAERRVVDMSLPERLTHMGKYKEEGNSLYDEGQYARAAIKYKRSMIYFEYCFPDTPEEEKTCDDIRLVCLANSAACFLKIGDYDETMEMCKQALRMDPDNVKCLYRIAVVYRKRDDYDLATENIDKAIRLQPDDKKLRIEKELLRAAIKSYRANTKKMGDMMFRGKGSADTTDPATPAEEATAAADTATSATTEEIEVESEEKDNETQFQSATTDLVSTSHGETSLKLDDLFVPIAVDTKDAESIIDGMSGINLMDATTFRNVVKSEDKKKGPLGWAFRHPISCECESPDIEFGDEEAEEEDYEEEEEEDDIDEDNLIISESKTMVGGVTIEDRQEEALREVEPALVAEVTEPEPVAAAAAAAPPPAPTPKPTPAPAATPPVDYDARLATAKRTYDVGLFIAAAVLVFAGLIKHGSGPIPLCVLGAMIGLLVEKKFQAASKAKSD